MLPRLRLPCGNMASYASGASEHCCRRRPSASPADAPARPLAARRLAAGPAAAIRDLAPSSTTKYFSQYAPTLYGAVQRAGLRHTEVAIQVGGWVQGAACLPACPPARLPAWRGTECWCCRPLQCSLLSGGCRLPAAW